MGSLGAVCVTIIIIFVISYFFYSMQNTNYEVFTTPNDADPMKPIKDFHYLFLFNPGKFSNLAALLCVGYYVHQFTIPIISTAEYPEKNIRNVGLGYTLVFITYVIVGTCGYIAFTGTAFDKSIDPDTGLIVLSQNFLNMF